MSVEITQIKEKITEIRGKKSEDRGQKTEVGRQIFCFLFSVFCFLSPVFAQEAGYAFSKTDRDPFSPLISKSGVLLIPREVNLGGLVIKGIIYSKESPVAIINDEVVEKGGNIGDYLVLDIEEKRVILKKGDQEFILKLEEDEE